jgi:hypothetical protein
MSAMSAMKCFAYLSHATRPETRASLAALAQQCQALNTPLEVTGVLTCTDGCFAQFIEGPRDGVDEVIARIKASQRHRDITVLGESAIDARAFAGSPMLWRHVGVPEELERAKHDARLTSLQADLVNRILLFTRWEGGASGANRDRVVREA